MEYILSVIWREQMAHARILRKYSGIHLYIKASIALEINIISYVAEFAPILHISHLIASEMLHFVQQIQYYINFEVFLIFY